MVESLFKVGDEVITKDGARGKVITIANIGRYPLTVVLETENGGSITVSYALDGCYYYGPRKMESYPELHISLLKRTKIKLVWN